MTEWYSEYDAESQSMSWEDAAAELERRMARLKATLAAALGVWWPVVWKMTEVFARVGQPRR